VESSACTPAKPALSLDALSCMYTKNVESRCTKRLILGSTKVFASHRSTTRTEYRPERKTVSDRYRCEVLVSERPPARKGRRLRRDVISPRQTPAFFRSATLDCGSGDSTRPVKRPDIKKEAVGLSVEQLPQLPPRTTVQTSYHKGRLIRRKSARGAGQDFRRRT
jgi:hypothetical protein